MHGPTTEHILERLLADNEELASHNREHFDELGVLTMNIMSAPGAGKTLLAAALANALRNSYRSAVIEGDMVGNLDVARLAALNIAAFQISTGRSCHLDAQMVAQFLHNNKLPDTDLLIIENVGNLVCPAEFPLGEHLRIVLLSVSEGDDKPLKYPVIFHRCDAVILSKCDLLPYVDFNSANAQKAVKDLNPHAKVFELSALSGQGISEWVDWVASKIGEHKRLHCLDDANLRQAQ